MALTVPEAPVELQEKTAQAVVAGSGLIFSEEGVSKQVKEDLLACTLFAQFAAQSKVGSSTNVVEWYEAYFDALRNLGWAMSSQDFREHTEKGNTVLVHKAIMSVLTAVLGPAATALVVIKSVFDGLEQVGSDNGWLTFFDRQSVQATVAKFQVVTAQPTKDGQINIGLVGFELRAEKTITQVLFFKSSKSKVRLRFAGGPRRSSSPCSQESASRCSRSSQRSPRTSSIRSRSRAPSECSQRPGRMVMDRRFIACKQRVHNRGVAPDAFLDELVDWGQNAAEEIFEENDKFDVYSSVIQELGPYKGAMHRRATMLEVLRVLGGFESSWDWNAGRDVTNPNSNTACTEEAGIFQCSGDSMNFSPSLKNLLVATGADGSCESFIKTTKTNHPFAIEYCARLLRFTTKHHGPIKDRHINPWLRRDAATEFMEVLGQ